MDYKMEILKIMTSIPEQTINKKHELLNYCSHVKYELLENVDTLQNRISEQSDEL